MELTIKQSILLLLLAFFFLGVSVGTHIQNTIVAKNLEELAGTPYIGKAGDNYYKLYKVNYSSNCLGAGLCMNYTITDKWDGKE